MQLLNERGVVGEDIISVAKEQLRSEGVSNSELDSKAVELLVEKHYCTFEQIYQILSDEFNMPLASLEDISIGDDVKNAVPEDVVRKYNILPLGIENGQMEVAISDPMDMDAIDNLTHIIGMPLDLRLASPHQITSRANFPQSSTPTLPMSKWTPARLPKRRRPSSSTCSRSLPKP